MDKVIAGLEGIRKIVDDILNYNSSLPVQKNRTRSFLDQCRHHGATLKPTNSQLVVTGIVFGGFRLSSTGIQTYLSPSRIFLLTDIRSLFSFVNQLGNFSKELTEIMAPFRPLLAKDSVLQWLPEHDHAFVEAKSRLSIAIILTYFGCQ